jgi:hypothetical protein
MNHEDGAFHDCLEYAPAHLSQTNLAVHWGGLFFRCFPLKDLTFQPELPAIRSDASSAQASIRLFGRWLYSPPSCWAYSMADSLFQNYSILLQ